MGGGGGGGKQGQGTLRYYFCWVTEIILYHNPLEFFLKKGHLFWRIKGKNPGFFYSISKQGTKVFFFFKGGGGGGGLEKEGTKLEF